MALKKSELYSSLWSSCDELRGGMDASQYKDYVLGLMRAYGNIADELEAAGLDATDIAKVKRDVDRYVKLREIIKLASGETIDLKAYEADMRHLIDTYIEADAPRVISPFEGMPLLDLIVKSGIAAAVNSLPAGLKGNQGAVAETIANNVRSRIIKDRLTDPAYYDRMSVLLEEVLADLKARRIDYQQYLKRVADLAKQVHSGVADEAPKVLKNSPGLRALYNNLKLPGGADVVQVREHTQFGDGDPRLDVAIRLDEAIKAVRPDGWRGVDTKERVIKGAIYNIIPDVAEVERLFLIVKSQREY